MVFSRPSCAMVLAAGYGHRMRPLTDNRPKPLVPFAGKPLLDHVLDRLADAGVACAVVNVHYLPEQIEAHLATRIRPEILISDERAQILDTGGAVQKALPLLGSAPFFVHNSDSVWIERNGSALRQMMQAWDEDAMDSLLLLAPVATSLGYSGRGDYAIGANGRPCRRRRDDAAVPHVFAGVSINHPRIFQNCPDGPFSILRLWDEAESAGRLAAIQLDGQWMHIGTPEALAEAEERLNGQPA
jgi:N-acetyl-alpha-D-muramate 1-phosphate uridylyltransferase